MRSIVACLFLFGCGHGHDVTPQAVERTSNPNETVTLLFEKDGYRIFRFVDDGRYRYFVIPAGTVMWDHEEPRPKSAPLIVPESSSTGERR